MNKSLSVKVILVRVPRVDLGASVVAAIANTIAYYGARHRVCSLPMVMSTHRQALPRLRKGGQSRLPWITTSFPVQSWFPGLRGTRGVPQQTERPTISVDAKIIWTHLPTRTRWGHSQ